MIYIIILFFVLTVGAIFFRLHLYFFPKKRLVILMYHSVLPTSQSEMTVSVDQLEKQLQYLLKNNYKALFFKDLSKPLLPKSIILTFDDGYRDNKDYLLPLLEKYRMKATIFIPTGKIEKDSDKMSFSDLRNLPHQNIELALHSHNHLNYRDISLDEVERDLLENIKTMKDQNIPFSNVLAYPYGKYPKKNQNFFEILKKMNMEYAVRIGNKINYFPPQNPYEICRVSVDGSDSLLKFKLKLIFGKLKL